MALSRREILKKLVKVKLDELSPFDNLHGDNSTQDFIAADGDKDYDEVNPISSYIEQTIDKAANYCLNDLPLSLLVDDADYDTEYVHIDRSGVGHIECFDKYKRLTRVSVHSNHWDRDVTEFITSSDEDYKKQQNKWTRGGCSKPVVAMVPEKQELELYSFSCCTCSANADVYYIDCNKVAEKVKSPIDDYIALRCAAYILEILGDDKKAAVMIEEYEMKKKGVLK